MEYGNFGKTPALRVSGFAQPSLVVSTAKLNFSKWGDPLEDGRAAIYPGGGAHIVREIDALPGPIFDDLIQEKSFAYIFGNIDYEDVFEYRHYTHFCMRYSVPSRGFAACDTFNDIDP